MSKGNSEYEFYVGEGTHLEGASLDIHGTARIDGTFVGKISVKHLIVGEMGRSLEISLARLLSLRELLRTLSLFLESWK